MFNDCLDKDEIKYNIANNLKKLRSKRGMTQEDLIYDLGEELISLRSYKSYESEKSKIVPSLDKIVILAKYFGCTVDRIIFGYEGTYDESYTKKDNLKRICALIYSLVLRPVKENDPTSPYYGQYYFLAYDQEVSLLIDKIEAMSREKNIKFYQTGEISLDHGKCYYDLINQIEDLDENWEPSASRFKYLLNKSNIDVDDYYEMCINKINRERKPKKRIK